ncbi:hypothetical protein [Senegalimassilia anaerobia]|uniref:hypothetical protein n=1 Tax=Senegalimassilia anaerobia TaxID=1473216 RepID=UPI00267311AE|nr:hypothetical protein [Senegalimassilia anaerobia]
MSCWFCERNRDMRGAAFGAGCKVKEICIERIIGFRGGLPVGDSFRINVELPEGYAMTLPINYCPMCGSLLTERMNYER